MADVEIAVEFIQETSQTYRFSDGKSEFWIPKSAVSDYCETKGVISSIFISEWWANEKDLL